MFSIRSHHWLSLAAYSRRKRSARHARSHYRSEARVLCSAVRQHYGRKQNLFVRCRRNLAHQLGSKSHCSTGLNAVREMKRPALRRDREARTRIRELATRRVEAAWACANALRPDLPENERKALAQQFLDLSPEQRCPLNPLYGGLPRSQPRVTMITLRGVHEFTLRF